MNLAEYKGEEAFKVMGRLIRVFKSIFKDENVMKIIKEKETGWILDLFDYSLAEQSDKWLEMFCILNSDKKKEDVSTMDVIKFAYDFKNDEMLMSLFFSQSQMNSKTSFGSATENTMV